MDFQPKDFVDLGGTVVVILAFLAYLTIRDKKKNGNGTTIDKEILKTLEVQNSNHLEHMNQYLSNICDKVGEGNEKVVGAINSGNMKIVETLGRIEGKIS